MPDSIPGLSATLGATRATLLLTLCRREAGGIIFTKKWQLCGPSSGLIEGGMDSGERAEFTKANSFSCLCLNPLGLSTDNSIKPSRTHSLGKYLPLVSKSICCGSQAHSSIA